MTVTVGGDGQTLHGSVGGRLQTIAFEIAGTCGASWTDDDGQLAFSGEDYLMRQVS